MVLPLLRVTHRVQVSHSEDVVFGSVHVCLSMLCRFPSSPTECICSVLAEQ